MRAEKLRNLMNWCGMTSKQEARGRLRRGRIRIDGQPSRVGSRVEAGNQLLIEGYRYQVVEVPDRDRLTIEPLTPPPSGRISGRHRLYCGYHKCLTMYTRRVFESTYASPLVPFGSFRHFFHRVDEFERFGSNCTVASVSGHAIDLDRYEDVRVVRFVRDPRDLVVSGYFYHKRAAEPWCKFVGPAPVEWRVVNGAIPAGIGPGRSFAEYLNKVSLEEGLQAEIDFRRHHFESMLAWPDRDPRILLLRYEDTIGNEVEIFRKIFEHLELPALTRRVGLHYVDRFRASKRPGSDRHIRDARSGQWREHFTPALTERFRDEHAEALEKLGYPAQ